MKNVMEIRNPLNLAVASNLCVHAVTGQAPGTKGCANGYHCGSCPFDQMLDDMAGRVEDISHLKVIRAA